ncbi:MAG: ABC transporter ATP-binding protein, partial [Clostridiales bacterium]|nr:ABC transporter ATP-binding protein [Clostridiales bacterium]
MQKKKDSFTTVVKNISFVIGYSFNNCKMRVISIFIIALFSGINAANVALFYKYAIESLERDNPFLFLSIAISIYLLIHLSNIVVNSIFTNVKFPIWDLKIKNGISKKLYDKYISIDLFDMNNSEFYDKYVRALSEAEQRSVQVLNTFQYFLSNLFSTLGVLTVVAMLNPVLIIFSIVPVISSFFINMKITKERYNYEMSLTQENRKNDYIKRIFSLPQYREEIRTNDYNELLFNKYSNSNNEIINIIKTKMPSIINKSVFGANLFSLINYGVPAVYLGWQVLNKLISIGDFSTLLIGTANLSSSIFYMVILAPQLAEHSLFINNLREILDYKSSMEPTEDVKAVHKDKS